MDRQVVAGTAWSRDNRLAGRIGLGRDLVDSMGAVLERQSSHCAAANVKQTIIPHKATLICKHGACDDARNANQRGRENAD
jgi:hypothetical protein